MPLYEYECDACGHRFEVIHQRFSDAPIEICPKCGGAVRKLFSSPAIQFKGSGWYITDYARAGKSEGSDKSAGSEKSEGSSATDASTNASDSKGESKGESKTESKSVAKTDSKSESKSASSDSKPAKS
jgi:putative FmdB family regulatory protein